MSDVLERLLLAIPEVDVLVVQRPVALVGPGVVQVQAARRGTDRALPAGKRRYFFSDDCRSGLDALQQIAHDELAASN